MAPQFCLPEPHRYEFTTAPKSILWPTGHVLHGAFEKPSPHAWKKVPKEKEVYIDEEREFIFLPGVRKGRQPKYELTKRAEHVEELGYRVYEHFSGIFDPVVIRKIPFNGVVITLSCKKVPEGMQITARLMSGREVFSKEYPLHEKVRVFNIRFEIQQEIVQRHAGSSNTTFHLVLEGQTSRLRGNALIGLSSKSPAPESKEKKVTSKKLRFKQKTCKTSSL